MLTYKETPIFYSDTGNGNPVVLLHGFLESVNMWNTVVKELSPKNRIVCIDLLGHGKSGCLGYIHTMEEMAAAVKFVLDHLQINKALFIGHSMGGYVALTFAKNYANNITGICLMNSTSQMDSDIRKTLRKKANKIAQQNYEQLIKMAVLNLFSAAFKEAQPEKINQVVSQALQTSVQAYIACNEGMRLRENNESTLESISKRAIIAGKNDAVLSFSSLKKEAKRTQTDFVEFPNGHMSHIEDQDLFIAFLKDFVV